MRVCCACGKIWAEAYSWKLSTFCQDDQLPGNERIDVRCWRSPLTRHLDMDTSKVPELVGSDGRRMAPNLRRFSPVFSSAAALTYLLWQKLDVALCSERRRENSWCCWVLLACGESPHFHHPPSCLATNFPRSSSSQTDEEEETTTTTTTTTTKDY